LKQHAVYKPLNKTLAITAIVLVAVVMGISAVVPMMPTAYADPVEGRCPSDFVLVGIFSLPTDLWARAGTIDRADGTIDSAVCKKVISTPQGDRIAIVDNNLPITTGRPR